MDDKYYGGVLVSDLENMAKTHIRSALSIAYGEGLLVGINRAKKAMLEAAPPADVESVAIYQVGVGYGSLINWYDKTKQEFDETTIVDIVSKRILYTQPPADVEPVAWMAEDGRVVNVHQKSIMHKSVADNHNIALFTQPPEDKDAERWQFLTGYGVDESLLNLHGQQLTDAIDKAINEKK